MPGTNIWKWHTVKKGLFGVVNGLTYPRCFHHPDPEGCWIGLYVCHTEKDNDVVVANNNVRYRQMTDGSNNSTMTVVEEEAAIWLCNSASTKYFVVA